METQLYRKLEAGELVEAGDLIWMDEEGWETVNLCHLGEAYQFEEAALRPWKLELGPTSTYVTFPPQVPISLRQHYAGLAMQAYVSLFTPENVAVHKKMCPHSPLNEYFAACSVQMADALIAALEKKEDA